MTEVQLVPLDQLHCNGCGKSVSTQFMPVPTDTPDRGLIIRAWIACPECIEAQAAEQTDVVARLTREKQELAKQYADMKAYADALDRRVERLTSSIGRVLAVPER